MSEFYFPVIALDSCIWCETGRHYEILSIKVYLL